MHPLNGDHLDELAVFLGASYFRVLAAGQHYGLSARGLAIDTGLAKKEEFPYFREFWLKKPQPGDRRSEEHTSELQSLRRISYAVFCLKKKKQQYTNTTL